MPVPRRSPASLLAQGRTARIIPAQFVRHFLRSGKNDFNDATAIADAVTRPTMRFVPIKSAEQLDLQALHRARERFVHDRTAAINQIRAFLLENDIAVRTGRAALRRELPFVLEDAENSLSARMRALLPRLWQHWERLEGEIKAISTELERVARERDDCQRLLGIPGIGPLSATALVAAIGTGSQFARGRQLGAWLGLVPRQHSTGDKPRLLGISKRGTRYLRCLLIHGARSVCLHLRREGHALGQWVERLQRRAHRNVVVVAIANKIARISLGGADVGLALPRPPDLRVARRTTKLPPRSAEAVN